MIGERGGGERRRGSHLAQREKRMRELLGELTAEERRSVLRALKEWELKLYSLS